MKEPKRRRSLSGAVLVMILTVMFVLIILLTATLTTVTTANQRIYTKFEENQAYYTARSALDVFTQNMLSDNSYLVNPAKYFEYTDSDGTVKGGAGSSDPAPIKQGLALQLDLYKIRSQSDDGMDLGFAENAVMGDSTFITSSPEDEHFALNNTDGTPTERGLKYIEYNIKLPKVSNGSDTYGKMVDNVSLTGIGDTSDATIRVEVLDRKYATDPSYTTDEINKYINHIGTSIIPNDAALKAAIQNGSRSKDYMKIKITATVNMFDTEGVAIVIFETTQKDPPANEQALTTSGTATGRGGSSPAIQGGFSTMATDVTYLVTGDKLSGTVFSLGTFETATSGCNLNLSEGSSIVSMKGLNIPSGSTTIKATDKNRFMFLGGTSVLHGNVGDSTNGISTIADTLKLGDYSATLNYYGNIYANKIILGGGGSSISINGGSTYVNEIEVPDGWLWLDDSGNINMSMDGADVFNKLHAVLNNGFTIHDASNSIEINSANITSVIGQNGRTLSYSSQSFNKIDFSNDPAVGTYSIVNNDGQLYRKYQNLPFTIDSKTEIEVPTPQSYFADYYIDGAFNPASGDLGLYKDATGDIDYSVTDYDMIYDEDNNVIKMLKTGAYLFEDYLSDGNASYVRKNSIEDIINDGVLECPLWTDAMANSPVDISGGDKYFELSGTYYKPIQVTGNGDGRLIFLVREGNSAKFDGIGSGFTLTTDNINDTKTNIVNGTTKAPKVDIYGGTDSKLELGNRCTLAGYIIMPTGDMKIENGNMNMTYDGESANNTCIVGSILCRSFDAGNHPGILYLDKDSGANSPGEPHLTVQANQYVRN